jgi:hypothetical protein
MTGYSEKPHTQSEHVNEAHVLTEAGVYCVCRLGTCTKAQYEKCQKLRLQRDKGAKHEI